MHNIWSFCNSNVCMYKIENIISAENCEKLIEEIKNTDHRDGHVCDGSVVKVCDHRLCSENNIWSQSSTDIIKECERKVCEIFGLDINESESIVGVRYKQGHYYKDHVDFFSEPFLQQKRQRTWSCVFYLNSNFEGGHTVFPHLNLSIKPEQGNAIIWHNHLSNSVNYFTQHRSDEVTSGNKYVLTKFFTV